MRFSKQALRAYVEKRQRAIQDEAGYTFDRGNGHAQVDGAGPGLDGQQERYEEGN